MVSKMKSAEVMSVFLYNFEEKNDIFTTFPGKNDFLGVCLTFLKCVLFYYILFLFYKKKDSESSVKKEKPQLDACKPLTTFCP